MAEEVKQEEKNEKHEKTMTDGEKYRALRKRCMIAGRIAAGFAVGTGIAAGAYALGKHAGAYACLEDIYNRFPDIRDTIKVVDPAFFTTLA